jgi:hypothetical protein
MPLDTDYQLSQAEFKGTVIQSLTDIRSDILDLKTDFTTQLREIKTKTEGNQSAIHKIQLDTKVTSGVIGGVISLVIAIINALFSNAR